MINLKVKTDEKLLKRLEEAAKRKMTKEEKMKQRISFIYAGMSHDSSISKQRIEEILNKAS